MNGHRAPPPPPPPYMFIPQTTNDILKKTTSIFSTPNNLLMLLLLSLILFCLRAFVEMGADELTSFVDDDPSIKSYIHRIYGPPNSTSTIITSHKPFLKRFGNPISDDGYFSGDNEFNRRLFSSSLPKPQINATPFILDSFDSQMGFFNFVSDNGIRASEIVRSRAKMTFRLIEIREKEENTVINGSNNSAPFNESVKSNADFQSLLKRFDLQHHEFTAVTTLISVVFALYFVFMIAGFLVTYTMVHGIIYVLVLNDFCKRPQSFAITLASGSFLGGKRLSGFIKMRLAVREALNHLLGLWFFQSITDPSSFLKIFLRYMFMPYSIMLPWVKGFEKEIHGFLVLWVMIDMLMSYVFAVSVWIIMEDSRRNWIEVVKESCHLLKLFFKPAVDLKFIEGILCGPLARSVLKRHFGVWFAIAFQSFMEVYFMVAWIVYYLSLKFIDAISSGRSGLVVELVDVV